MAKRKAEDPPAGLPAWMGTYGDLVTLLLCFFILMFAMSSVDAAKFEALASSFNPSFIMSAGGAGVSISEGTGSGLMQLPSLSDSINTGQKADNQVDTAKKMAAEFKTYFAESNLSQTVDVTIVDNNTIKITFNDPVLFEPGKAILSQASKNALDIVATQLKTYTDAVIRIEGHTDNIPINTAQFPSNMYLSSARAIAVYEYYSKFRNISPNRMSAEGFAEYKPVAPNNTPENRAKNRRIEIFVTTASPVTGTTGTSGTSGTTNTTTNVESGFIEPAKVVQ